MASFGAIRDTEHLVLGFFVIAWAALVLMLAVSPEVRDVMSRRIPGAGGPAIIGFVGALSLFLAVLAIGVLRRWRWLFWLILVAFRLSFRIAPEDAARAASLAYRVPGHARRQAHRDYASRPLTDALMTALAMEQPFTPPGLEELPDVVQWREANGLWRLVIAATLTTTEHLIREQGPSDLAAMLEDAEVVWHSPWRSRVAVHIARQDVDLLRSVLAAIATNLDGTPASTSTTNRKRAALSSALVYAVERGDLDSNPLQRVKSRRRPHTDAIDARVVVSPAEARSLLSEIAELAPALHAFFACLYFGGLRPSEAANLRRINLKLPTAGWGEIVLLSSYQPTRSEWTDDGRAGEERSLKHRAAKATRRVPAHPELVVALHQHLSTFGVGSEDRLFVSRTGRGGRPLAGPFVRPVSSASTSRVLQRARAAAFTPEQEASPLARRPYDLRHACLSTWLAAGVPPTQVAAWAGHSVAVLLRVYAHALDDQEGLSKRRIAAALEQSWTQIGHWQP